MTLLTINALAPEPELIDRAAALLRQGELVALPTETVYGLGANALDSRAVQKIFEAKGRPSHNPLIVHVADAAAARSLSLAWPDNAERLALAFWPGPLTLVLPRTNRIPDLVTAGLPTVALRVPHHPVMQAVIVAAGFPIAAPSANRSGEVSPTRAEHVLLSLGDQVPLILDAGPTDVGLESTVVDLSGDLPVLLRPGVISEQDLVAVIGTLGMAASPSDLEGARPSPGMLDRHYAPRAELRLFDSALAPDIEAQVETGRSQGRKVGVMAWSSEVRSGNPLISLPRDPFGTGRMLYEALHRFDAEGCQLILAEQPPSGPEWAAIRDRLERAARR